MTQSKHSPLPWGIDEDYPKTKIVSVHADDYAIRITADPNDTPLSDEAQANADLIVRAVNNHQELLEACKAMLAFIGTHWKSGIVRNDVYAGSLAEVTNAIDNVKAAIASAEGKANATGKGVQS